MPKKIGKILSNAKTRVFGLGGGGSSGSDGGKKGGSSTAAAGNNTGDTSSSSILRSASITSHASTASTATAASDQLFPMAASMKIGGSSGGNKLSPTKALSSSGDKERELEDLNLPPPSGSSGSGGNKRGNSGASSSSSSLSDQKNKRKGGNNGNKSNTDSRVSSPRPPPIKSSTAASATSSSSGAQPPSQQSASETTTGAAAEAATASSSSSISGLKKFFHIGSSPLTSTSGYNELFTEQKDLHQHSWWKLGQFKLGTFAQPALFGTWDGVFITCVVHLFGVISFLRTGWLVGNEGILLSIGVVFGCLLFTTISLLAAIGIMQRCAAVATNTNYYDGDNRGGDQNDDDDHQGDDGIDGGGGGAAGGGEYTSSVASARANVHLLYSTVLGSRIGGAISLIYCFGQAVSCALHVCGFTETFVTLCYMFIQRHLVVMDRTTTTPDSSSTSSSSDMIMMTKNDWCSILAKLLAKLLMIEIYPSSSTSSLLSSSTSSSRSSSMSSSLSGGDSDHRRMMMITSTIGDAIVSSSSSSLPSSPSSPEPVTLVLTAYTFQIVSTITIVVLFIFNVIGVRCLFRLQSLLFVSLLLAVLDFTTGLFQTHADFGYGPIVASMEHFRSNQYPIVFQSTINSSAAAAISTPPAAGSGSVQEFWRQLFIAIGVFFPSAIGVMAGVNMGSDLKCPTRSIPLGSLSAIVTSFAIHLLFIIGLGITCTRAALLNDYQIGQHVSTVGVFFLCGLYMSALSSSLGSMYTAPRIMQNLAQELHSFPVVRCFAAGRGPNKIPINALILFTLLTLAFVNIGDINDLAPIVTIPYLLTYATIEYAYFSMAMTFDIQIAREKRFMTIATQLRDGDGNGGGGGHSGGNSGIGDYDDDADADVGSGYGRNRLSAKDGVPPTEITALSPSTSSISMIRIEDLDGGIDGGGGNGGGGSGGENGGIGPVPPSPTPSIQHLAGYGSVQATTAHIKIKRRQSTQSSSDENDGSDGSDDDAVLGSFGGNSRLRKSTPSIGSSTMLHSPTSPSPQRPSSSTGTTSGTTTTKKKTIRQLMAAESDDDDDDDDDEDYSNADDGGGGKLKDGVVDGGNQEVLLSSGDRSHHRSHHHHHQGSVFRFETSTMYNQNNNNNSLLSVTNKGGNSGNNSGNGNSIDKRQATVSLQCVTPILPPPPSIVSGGIAAATNRTPASSRRNNNNDNGVCERLLNPDPELAEIACKQQTWYLRVMNRWIVLIAAVAKFALMFFIAWHYAAIAVAAAILAYIIIGRTNPGFYPGVSEFALLPWLRNFSHKLFRRQTYGLNSSASTTHLVASYSYDRIVLPPAGSPASQLSQYSHSDQLTHENSDYASRKPFHGSTVMMSTDGEFK